MDEFTRLYLIYGPPASGKTTLGRALEGAGDFVYLSVGEITRVEIKSKTNVGLMLQECLDKVVEYPPELIGSLIEEKLAEAKKTGKKILLDGYPKYVQEVDMFVAVCRTLQLRPEGIVIVDLSSQVGLMRANERRICSVCLKQLDSEKLAGSLCPHCKSPVVSREDDSDESWLRRYNDYERSIRDTVESLSEKFKLRIVKIDGEEAPRQAFSKVLSFVDTI